MIGAIHLGLKRPSFLASLDKNRETYVIVPIDGKLRVYHHQSVRNGSAVYYREFPNFDKIWETAKQEKETLSDLSKWTLETTNKA